MQFSNVFFIALLSICQNRRISALAIIKTHRQQTTRGRISGNGTEKLLLLLLLFLSSAVHLFFSNNITRSIRVRGAACVRGYNELLFVL